MSKVTQIGKSFLPKTDLFQFGGMIVQTTVHNAKSASRQFSRPLQSFEEKPDTVEFKGVLKQEFEVFKQTCRTTVSKFFASRSELKTLKEKYSEIFEIAEQRNQLSAFKGQMKFIGESYINSPEKEKQIVGNIILGRVLKLYSGDDDHNLKATAKIAQKLLDYNVKQGNLVTAKERSNYAIDAYEKLIENANEKLYNIGIERDKRAKKASIDPATKHLQNEQTKEEVKAIRQTLRKYRQKRHELLKTAVKLSNEILTDYERYTTEYKPQLKMMMTKEGAEIDKAYLLTQLAGSIAHEKRNKAVEYLREAYSIYEKYDRQPQLRFMDVQISRLKTSRMPNKLQEYKKKFKTKISQDLIGSTIKRYKTLRTSRKKAASAYSKFDESQLTSNPRYQRQNP